MSDTSVRTAPASPAPAVVAPSGRPTPPWTFRRALKPLASLRLTVALFALSLLLVFFGTLAQIESGIWTVVADYFRSWTCKVPLQLFVKFGQVFFGVPKDLSVGGAFWFFGGKSLGAALLVNLLAAHALRFRATWDRAGILAIHAGLIVLMLGELGTGELAVEQRMSIAAGETVAFTDESHRVELAFLTPDPADRTKDLVAVVPQSMLREGRRVADPALPVDVEVLEFWRNSEIIYPADAKGAPLPNERKALNGAPFGFRPESESSGVEVEAREDMPAARVALYKKGGDEKVGEFFLTLWFYSNLSKRMIEFAPQEFTLDGRTYTVELRPERHYKDYALTLQEFRFDKYKGTSTPKNFSSRVTVASKGGDRREYTISMNHPLFHSGETLYQSSYFPGNDGTVLQVVRNPVWWMPYLSCVAVTLGMIAHFGRSLFVFLQRRAVG